MNKAEALSIARDYIASEKDCVIYDEHTIEFDRGFCFIWNTIAYQQSGNILEDMAVGPAPFIVPKNGGDIFCLGSSYSSERLIDEYTRWYEEEHQCYALFFCGDGKPISLLRSRYNLSPAEIKDVLNKTAPLLQGSRQRLDAEQIELQQLGINVNVVQVKQ